MIFISVSVKLFALSRLIEEINNLWYNGGNDEVLSIKPPNRSGDGDENGDVYVKEIGLNLSSVSFEDQCLDSIKNYIYVRKGFDKFLCSGFLEFHSPCHLLEPFSW